MTSVPIPPDPGARAAVQDAEAGRADDLGRRAFHVSPTDFAPGEQLVPGSVLGVVTTRSSTGARVYLTDSLDAARVWARYVGERSLSERVAIYAVRVDGELAPAPARRGVPQVSTLEADGAVVLGCLEWVNPWQGRPPGYREALAAVPF